MNSSREETLLVLRAQTGDREALELLLRRIYAPLRGYLRGMLEPSIAEDALQDTSFQIYRKLRWLREPTVFRSWAFRIASRIAFAHLARERRWRASDRDPEILNSIQDPVSLHWDYMSRARFTALLGQVTPACRAVLLLHYEEDLSLQEVAAILSIPLGTVKSRLQYGINILRKHLKENETT